MPLLGIARRTSRGHEAFIRLYLPRYYDPVNIALLPDDPAASIHIEVPLLTNKEFS